MSLTHGHLCDLRDDVLREYSVLPPALQAPRPKFMSEPDHFLSRWGPGPLAVYVVGIFVPVIVAALRSELMIAVGVPVYTVLFWMGPFAAIAAVFWTGWSAAWRTAWVLLVPLLSAAALGIVFIEGA